MSETSPRSDTTEGSELLRERFARHQSSLSRAERTIAEYLVGVAVTELPFLNAEQIAAATGTSDASVTRAARRLGFTGLPELKRHAVRPHAIAAPAPDRLARRLDELADPDETVARYFDAAQEILTESQRVLSPQSLEAAVAILCGADTVWSVGVGSAASAALQLSDVLSRAGRRTRWTRATGFDLANELVSLRSGDAVVLFHAARVLPDVEHLIDYAHRHEVPLILVSGPQLAAVHASRVRVTLSSVGSASRFASWNLGAHAVAELLGLGVAAADPAAAVDAHRRLGELRSALAALPGEVSG